MVGSLAVYGLTDDHAMPLLMLMVGLASSHGARET
jgi:hypothetical protein